MIGYKCIRSVLYHHGDRIDPLSYLIEIMCHVFMGETGDAIEFNITLHYLEILFKESTYLSTYQRLYDYFSILHVKLGAKYRLTIRCSYNSATIKSLLIKFYVNFCHFRGDRLSFLSNADNGTSTNTSI